MVMRMGHCRCDNSKYQCERSQSRRSYRISIELAKSELRRVGGRRQLVNVPEQTDRIRQPNNQEGVSLAEEENPDTVMVQIEVDGAVLRCLWSVQIRKLHGHVATAC